MLNPIFSIKIQTLHFTFFHEIVYRVFRYMQSDSGLGIKFKGLSSVCMGLLEYFTVSLNNSAVVNEDTLPYFYNLTELASLPDKVEWYDLFYGLIQKHKELFKGDNIQTIVDEFQKTGFPVTLVKY